MTEKQAEKNEDEESKMNMTWGRMDPWNKRKKETSTRLYLLIVLLCLLISYFFSVAIR